LTAELVEKQGGGDQAQGEPIGFFDSIDVISRDHGGGAGHILHDEIRIPWNVLAPKPGDRPRPKIVGAARGVPDYQFDCFTLVKISLSADTRAAHGQKQ
jgi:hypothetical protein